MRNTRCSLIALLLAALCAGVVAAPAARADDEALRRELEALKQRVETLERALAESKKAVAERPAADAEAVRTRSGSRVQVSGYTEMRVTNVGRATGERAENGDVDFQVTRFRPRINYLMDRHLTGSLQLNASTRSGSAASVNTRDAFMEYRNAAYALRIGQQKIPYGYQVFREGDETRAALERARVFGVLFPDERDIGLTWSTAPKNSRAAVLAVGVVNGDGINVSDGDGAKSVAGNVTVPLGRHNVIGASAYSGTTTARSGGKVVGRVKRAYGFEHRLSVGRLSTQIEYLWGRASGADVNGGYAQVAYDAPRLGTLFLRHDLFDPNEHAANDYWKRTGVGWFKEFTRQLRLTAEYDFVTNKLTRTAHDDTFGVEVQGNF